MNRSDQPLVSIVVITYNSAKYVLETLESAKIQTYQNVELIVSDDCSTDNTVEICQDWIRKNQFRFVRTKLITVINNTGIPANCNRGAKIANGIWLKFIAGDDVLCDNCIHDNVSFVNSNDSVRFVASKLINIDEESNTVENGADGYSELRKHYFAMDHEGQFRFYLRMPLFLNSPTFFINSFTLSQLNYFDEELRIYEDIPLIYKFNAGGYKIYLLDKVTVKYRLMIHSISRIKDEITGDLKTADQKIIFSKYRYPKLSFLNILDISVFYDYWLNYHYHGLGRLKGRRLLKLISPMYWNILIINSIKRS